jgi:predicted secreted protein
MTTGIAGRKVRIRYDSDGAGGTAAAVIARAKMDSFSFKNEKIDITAKDDNGVITLLNDVQTKGCEFSCSGIAASVAQHKTLVGLAVNAGAGTSLHAFECFIDGLGTIAGLFFIDSFDVKGEEAEATFEMALSSSGAVTWTAAA